MSLWLATNGASRASAGYTCSPWRNLGALVRSCWSQLPARNGVLTMSSGTTSPPLTDGWEPFPIQDQKLPVLRHMVGGAPHPTQLPLQTLSDSWPLAQDTGDFNPSPLSTLSGSMCCTPGRLPAVNILGESEDFCGRGRRQERGSERARRLSEKHTRMVFAEQERFASV